MLPAMSVSKLLPQPNDVFLGRGSRKANNFYRKLIRQHSKTYSELKNGKKKDFILSKIVQPIQDKGGTFYNHYPCDNPGVWRIASEDEIIKKIRSALTEYRKKVLVGTVADGEDDGDDDNDDDGVETEFFVLTKTPTAAAAAAAGNKRKAADVSRPTLVPFTNSTFINNTNPGKRQACAPAQVHVVDSATNSQSAVLYLNETTGHLLNIVNLDNNIYHHLLLRHATSFHDLFRSKPGSDLKVDDNNNMIRFVWDNIISELQKAKCHIILCPESRKSIDVDPNELDLRDSKNYPITFRTIQCIISALTDDEYIASIRSLFQRIASEQRSANYPPIRTSNSKYALAREFLPLSTAAADEIHRRIITSQQQQHLLAQFPNQADPVMVSIDSTSHTPTTLDLKNDGIGLNGLPIRQTATETMRAAAPQHWISSSSSSNHQLGRPRRESARDYLRKLQQENAEIQTAIENAQRQKAMQLQNAMNTENAMLLRRNLELLQQQQQQQSFTSSVSAPTLGMSRQPVLRRPSLPISNGRVGPIRTTGLEPKGSSTAQK